MLSLIAAIAGSVILYQALHFAESTFSNSPA